MAIRDASSPLTGMGRDALRTAIAGILAYFAKENLPPEIAAEGATVALIGLSALFAGLGKLARNKGWLIGTAI